eukprot:188562-Chlamydomonas_euryale.AAC.1
MEGWMNGWMDGWMNDGCVVERKKQHVGVWGMQCAGVGVCTLCEPYFWWAIPEYTPGKQELDYLEQPVKQKQESV